MAILVIGMMSVAQADNWPNWRGPDSNGIAPNADPPIKWSETENIKWKVQIPGDSDSTPIIWEDKLFIQTAIPTAEEPPPGSGEKPKSIAKVATVPYRFVVMCLSRETGEVLWEQTTTEELPHEGHHPTASFAAYSPVTDGELLWVSFGSRGLHCYDLDGNHQWSRGLIKMSKVNEFGEGSSPTLAGDAIVVQLDHEGQSKIMAFNKETGETLWEHNREEPSTWATPLTVDVDGALQVVVSGKNRIISHDAATGDIVWESAAAWDEPLATPVVANGNIFLASGFRVFDTLAIELGHTGDLTNSDAIQWRTSEDAPYVASPLVYGDNLYFISGYRALLSCYNATTGKMIYEKEKLDGLRQIYASPVGAGDRLYIACRRGGVAVVKQSNKFKLLATNTLEDNFDASPVVAGNELFLKGDAFLYCIAED